MPPTPAELSKVREALWASLKAKFPGLTRERFEEVYGQVEPDIARAVEWKRAAAPPAPPPKPAMLPTKVVLLAQAALSHLSDGIPRDFDRLYRELYDKAAYNIQAADLRAALDYLINVEKQVVVEAGLYRYVQPEGKRPDLLAATAKMLDLTREANRLLLDATKGLPTLRRDRFADMAKEVLQREVNRVLRGEYAGFDDRAFGRAAVEAERSLNVLIAQARKEVADLKAERAPPPEEKPLWMKTRDEAAVTYPMAVRGVPIGKFDFKKEREWEAAVRDAVAAGKPVPEDIQREAGVLVPPVAPQPGAPPATLDVAAPPPEPRPSVSADRVLDIIGRAGTASLTVITAALGERDDDEAVSATLTKTLGDLLEQGRVVKTSDGLAYKLYQPEDDSKNPFAVDNRTAVELTKTKGHDRQMVNRLYTGLGGIVENKRGLFGIREKRAGNLQQHYTMPQVAAAMAEMLAIPMDATVLDPACGSGRLLFACPNPRMVHGIEIEQGAYSVARAQFPAGVIVNDSLINHVWDEEFDYIVMNPPFSLMLEDTLRLLKHATGGLMNRAQSHLAVLEIAARALKPGGFFAAIVPEKTFAVHLKDSEQFLEWFYQEVAAVAEIDLPAAGTHSTSNWPVKLVIFQKRRGATQDISPYVYQKQTITDKDVFRAAVANIDELPSVVERWKKSEDWQYVVKYANSRKSRAQVKFAPVDITSFKRIQVEGVPQRITSEDIVEVDIDSAAAPFVETWHPDPIKLSPNGLPAGLHVAATRALYPIKTNEVTKRTVDVWKRDILQAGSIAGGYIGFDDLEVVLRVRSYDTHVRPSEGFVRHFARKREWVSIQNVPFTQYVDPELTGQFVPVNAEYDYAVTYPAIWAEWVAKFDEKAKVLPWLNGLKGYQKEDAIRLAIKSSAINAAMMGTGKSRVAIAVGELKAHPHNLLIVPSRLVGNWQQEFAALGMDPPFRIEFREDIAEARKHRWSIIAIDKVREKWEKVKERGTRSNPYEEVENPAFDATTRDWLGEQDALSAKWVLRRGGGTRANPRPGAEDTEEKEEAARFKVDLVTRFADHLAREFDFCVVDEAHILSNPTTARTSAVRKMKPKSWLFLTGTPIKNRVRGLYSLLEIGWGRKTAGNPYGPTQFMDTFRRMLGEEQRNEVTKRALQKVLGENPEAFMEFVDNFYESLGYERKGSKKKDQEVEMPGINNPDLLTSLMESKWLRRTKWEPKVMEDVQFVKPSISVHNPEMDESHKEFYKSWFEDAQAVIAATAFAGGGGDDEEDEDEKEVGFSGILWAMQKLRAAASVPHLKTLQHKAGEQIPGTERIDKGPLFYEKDAAFTGLSSREKEVLDLVDAQAKGKGKRLFIIAGESVEAAQTYTDELNKRGYEAMLITGSTPMRRRYEIIERYKTGGWKSVIVGTIGVLDVGLNLPSADVCVMTSPTWNWSDMEQGWSRMLRITSKGDKEVHVFVQKGTIEEYVWLLATVKRFNVEQVLDRVATGEEPEMVNWKTMILLMLYDAEKGVERGAAAVEG